VGVTAGSASSVASLAQAYLDAVSRGEGLAAAERFFHPDIVYIVNGPPTPIDGLRLPSLSSELQSGLPARCVSRARRGPRVSVSHAREPRRDRVRPAGDRRRRPAGGGVRMVRPQIPTGREVRSAFSLLLEQRDGNIARYQFLENTFDVALAFRNSGSWAMQTDGTTKIVPAER
jgi:ketosteroid isomerase-like protein